MDIPPNAQTYLPVLEQEARSHWPALRQRSILAGQVEQETCVSLRHAKCWSPRAELKTSREYGFGFGQITVTRRFDTFKELRLQFPSLREWQWEERYDPQRQMRALVLKTKYNYDYFEGRTIEDRIAFALASYNGGVGGLRQDKRMCAAKPGCDYLRWFGNVEKTSAKSRIKWNGYGRSAFEINRDYPKTIIFIRAPKYRKYLEEKNVP